MQCRKVRYVRPKLYLCLSSLWNIMSSLFHIQQKNAAGNIFLLCKVGKITGVKTRLRYKAQDVLMSTYMFWCSRSNRWKRKLHLPSAEDGGGLLRECSVNASSRPSWHKLTLYTRSTCWWTAEQRTMTMYSSQSLSGLKLTASADPPSTAGTLARLMFACHRLPTAQKQDSVFENDWRDSLTQAAVGDSPLSTQNWVICIVASWQPEQSKNQERIFHQSKWKGLKVTQRSEGETRSFHLKHTARFWKIVWIYHLTLYILVYRCETHMFVSDTTLHIHI